MKQDALLVLMLCIFGCDFIVDAMLTGCGVRIDAMQIWM